MGSGTIVFFFKGQSHASRIEYHCFNRGLGAMHCQMCTGVWGLLLLDTIQQLKSTRQDSSGLKEC